MNTDKADLTAKTFLAAAELMYSTTDVWVDGACVAIERVDPNGRSRAKGLLSDMFYADGVAHTGSSFYWLASPQGKDGGETDQQDRQNRELRVYALLLAASACKDFA